MVKAGKRHIRCLWPFTSLAFYNKAAGKVAAQDNQNEKKTKKNRHLAVAERSGVNENKK